MHIHSDLNSGHVNNLYHEIQWIIDELFYQYIKPLLKYIDHPVLIKEWKQNLDTDAYEKKIN